MSSKVLLIHIKNSSISRTERYKNIFIWEEKDEQVEGSSTDGIVLSEGDGLGVDPHTLGGVVGFVDANEAIGNLKHVVPQGDDDELSVLGLFLEDRTMEVEY